MYDTSILSRSLEALPPFPQVLKDHESVAIVSFRGQIDQVARIYEQLREKRKPPITAERQDEIDEFAVARLVHLSRASSRLAAECWFLAERDLTLTVFLLEQALISVGALMTACPLEPFNTVCCILAHAGLDEQDAKDWLEAEPGCIEDHPDEFEF